MGQKVLSQDFFKKKGGLSSENASNSVGNGVNTSEETENKTVGENTPKAAENNEQRVTGVPEAPQKSENASNSVGDDANTSAETENKTVGENIPKAAENNGQRVTGVSEAPPKMKISPYLTLQIQNAVDTLKHFGHTTQAAAVESAYKDTISEMFSVAVVGEFNKGKSTLVNKLIGKNVLPSGDLPTTAMLARVRYKKAEELILFDEKGKKIRSETLSKNFWKGLSAENFGGEDPKGVVLAGVNCKWLGANCIELIDTPGAGDLEESRARLIGDALLRSDAAIIVIDATRALSESEVHFIKQRLIARKTPFLMLAVTKLDLVELEERVNVIEYIKNSLLLQKMDIPVYIPYKIEMTDDSCDSIMGLDVIKEKIVSWMYNSKREALNEAWLSSRVLDILNLSLSMLKEQENLTEADEDKRRKIMLDKKSLIESARLRWDEICLEMDRRSLACSAEIMSKLDEYTGAIIEKLQYEASNTNSPQKWWTENYHYRVKIELSNLSVSIENYALKIISGDAHWLNNELAKNFKTQVSVAKGPIISKDDFASISGKKDLEFDDLTKQRNIVRVGTTVLSIGGAVLLAGMGAMPLIATMGIGTGVSIISEKVFKDKIEVQRAAVISAIAKNVPAAVASSASDCESRITQLYDKMIDEASKRRDLWVSTQEEALKTEYKPADDSKLKASIKSLETLTEVFQAKI